MFWAQEQIQHVLCAQGRAGSHCGWSGVSDGEISRRKVRKVPSLLRQGLEEPSRDSCLYSVERKKLL